jgi:hypothetical protein
MLQYFPFDNGSSPSNTFPFPKLLFHPYAQKTLPALPAAELTHQHQCPEANQIC